MAMVTAAATCDRKQEAGGCRDLRRHEAFATERGNEPLSEKYRSHTAERGYESR